MARESGAGRVIVIGSRVQRLALARKWGADHVIDTADLPKPELRAEALMELTGGRGADVALECAGTPAAVREGLGMVRRGGRYVVLGQQGGAEIQIDPFVLTRNAPTILGVWSGVAAHFYDALQFLRTRRQRYSFEDLITSRRSLHESHDALMSMVERREIKPLIVPPQ